MPRPQAAVSLVVAVVAALLLVWMLQTGDSVGVPAPIVVETSEMTDDQSDDDEVESEFEFEDDDGEG